LDFDVVPNGAYRFFHGGSIIGSFEPDDPIFARSKWFLNPNPYHPLFTIVIGGLLVHFAPVQSFFIWTFSKFFVTIAGVIYFYKEFKREKYTDFAIFLLLASLTQYDEIRIAQYQSVFNFFALLFLIQIAKGKNAPLLNGTLYFLTLIAKPISLLWLPVLLLKGQHRAAFIGLLMFALATIPWIFINNTINFYTDYILSYLTHPDLSGPIQMITLDALLRYSTTIPWTVLGLFKMLIWGFTAFLSSFKKVHTLKGIYLSAIYFLLFSGHVYEYYYTMLIPIFAVAIVTCEDFQKKSILIPIILASCPSILFVLRYFHIGFEQSIYYGPDPTFLGWQLMVLSKIVPLVCLTLMVIAPDMKLVFVDAKAFFTQLRKLNKQLQVFG